MSKPPSPAVYMDSCAIIAAHKIRLWRVLAGHFRIHTTTECWNELGRGDKTDPDYVVVDHTAIAADVEVHAVEIAQRVKAQVAAPKMGDIHLGEKELLAWCATQDPGALLLTTGDRAAILAGCQLGLADRLISLEELLEHAGQSVPLPRQYTKKWLTSVKTDYLLENLDS